MRSRTGWTKGGAVAVLVAFGVACSTPRDLSPPPTDPEPGNRPEYVIGVGDRILISVWRNEELSVQVPVRSDGKVSVPLLDDVQAEGLTALELKEIVTRELAEYVTAPDVTVTVLEMNSRWVSVIGAVGRNARLPLSGELRVLEAIALVGGFSQFANRSDVRIVRRGEGGEEEYRFNYKDYIKGRAPGTNIVLRHGDTIIVPE